MARWVPVTKDRHEGMRLQALGSYAFARNMPLVPIGLGELSRIVGVFPVVLVRRRGGGVAACALLGLEAGRNLFVDGKGRWSGEYVPAVLRAYPFRMAADDRRGPVLCVDEDSGMLHEGSEGEPLFDEHGSPSDFMLKLVRFLKDLTADAQNTSKACADLDEAGLIVPWPITVRLGGADQLLKGLFQVDENALNELGAEALRALRDSGALSLAYGQRFSAWRLRTLGRVMAERQAEERPPQKEGPPVTPSGELDLSFLSDQ